MQYFIFKPKYLLKIKKSFLIFSNVGQNVSIKKEMYSKISNIYLVDGANFFFKICFLTKTKMKFSVIILFHNKLSFVIFFHSFNINS